MIFSREYDKSLWLLLISDESKKDDVAGFVSEISQVLGDEIKSAIKEHEDYVASNCMVSSEDIEIMYFKGEVETSDGVLYWYDLISPTGVLYLGREVKVDEYYNQDLQICLEEKATFNHRHSKNFRKTEVGAITYGFKEELIGDEICYVDSNSTECNLMKTPFGTLLLSTSYSLGSRKTNSKKIDMMIPKDYNVEDLSSRIRLNRLVRRRKREFVSVKRDSSE